MNEFYNESEKYINEWHNYVLESHNEYNNK